MLIVLEKLVEHWQDECGCLAGAGGGCSDDVGTLHAGGDSLALDVRGDFEVGFLSRLEKPVIEIELSEMHWFLFLFLCRIYRKEKRLARFYRKRMKTYLFN